MTLKIDILLNTIANGDKGRFQVSGEFDGNGRPYRYFAARAEPGHGIPWLDQKRFACPVTEQDLEWFGCVVHVTTKEALTGIFRVGLLPGGSIHHDARAETDFGIYFPDDKRRETQARVGQAGYDVTIIFDRRRLAADGELFLSSNGVLLTKQPVSPLTFFSVVEQIPRTGERRLLYHELLM